MTRLFSALRATLFALVVTLAIAAVYVGLHSPMFLGILLITASTIVAVKVMAMTIASVTFVYAFLTSDSVRREADGTDTIQPGLDITGYMKGLWSRMTHKTVRNEQPATN